jgi:hypothetical protein
LVEGNGRNGYLLFVWAPTGYTLVERTGDPPELGAEVDGETRRYVVSKISPSPLPDDPRPCAYLLPA